MGSGYDGRQLRGGELAAYGGVGQETTDQRYQRAADRNT